MADLSTDEKIAIGVGAGVGGIVLVVLIAIFLWACYSGNRYGPSKRHPGRRFDSDSFGAFSNNGFVKPPEPRYYGPPYGDRRLPPPEGPYPMDNYPYREPRPIPREIEKARTAAELRESTYPTWDGNYREQPVVVSLAPPQFTKAGEREPNDTILVQYQDDQAIMERANNRRRSTQHNLRRTGSLQNLRNTRAYAAEGGRTTYTGDWDGPTSRPIDRMQNFNGDAYGAGRDPFLWQ